MKRFGNEFTLILTIFAVGFLGAVFSPFGVPTATTKATAATTTMATEDVSMMAESPPVLERTLYIDETRTAKATAATTTAMASASQVSLQARPDKRALTSLSKKRPQSDLYLFSLDRSALSANPRLDFVQNSQNGLARFGVPRPDL